MTEEQELQKLKEWTRHPPAAAMLLGLGQFSQRLDDVVDEEMSPINRSALLTDAVCDFLGVVTVNPYWVRNAHWLMPQVVRAMMEWDFSNRCQQSKDPVKHVHGFVRREALDGLIISIATHINGATWGRRVAAEVHKFYHIDNPDGDTVESWAAEAAE